MSEARLRSQTDRRGRNLLCGVPCWERASATPRVKLGRSSRCSCVGKKPTVSSVRLRLAGGHVTPVTVTSSASPPHQASDYQAITAINTTTLHHNRRLFGGSS
ncbi:hypothetical protein MTO96_031849 [Rhipicephalus appendiculatus]